MLNCAVCSMLHREHLSTSDDACFRWTGNKPPSASRLQGRYLLSHSLLPMEKLARFFVVPGNRLFENGKRKSSKRWVKMLIRNEIGNGIFGRRFNNFCTFSEGKWVN